MADIYRHYRLGGSLRFETLRTHYGARSRDLADPVHEICRARNRSGLKLSRFKDARNRFSKHLCAEYDVFVGGILTPVMADAVDRGHEHHCGRKLARDHLG